MNATAGDPPAADRPPAGRRKSAFPQIAAIVVGGLLALFGLGVALSGGAILVLFGSDGTLESGSQSLSTPTTALVSAVANIDGTGEVADVVGDPEVRLSVTTRRPGDGVFVGIGRAADVERYLARSPIEEVSDIEVDPFELSGRRMRPGPSRPDPPASRRFWVAEGSDRDTATMRWNLTDGDYRLVVMNADGRRNVQADGSVEVEIPHLPTVGWVLLGVGVLLLLGGVAAIVLAGVALARRPSPGASGTAGPESTS
jgi:hypothetical protein